MRREQYISIVPIGMQENGIGFGPICFDIRNKAYLLTNRNRPHGSLLLSMPYPPCTQNKTSILGRRQEDQSVPILQQECCISSEGGLEALSEEPVKDPTLPVPDLRSSYSLSFFLLVVLSIQDDHLHFW